MRSKHMVVVDDVPELLSSLERRLQGSHGNDYEVYAFTSAKDALEHIDNEIDANGNILALVASDEKMSGMQGHELLEVIGRTHSNAKRILYSGYTDYNALREALNQGVNEFVQKADPNESAEGLYAVIDAQLQEFERQPRIELVFDEAEIERLVSAGMIKLNSIPSDLVDLTIRLADTEYEKERLQEVRYSVYLARKYFEPEDLPEEQRESKREWDDYDFMPKTRFIVAKIGGTVIGGNRIIYDAIPVEKGELVKVKEGGDLERTGTLFSLEKSFPFQDYGIQQIQKREVSRLVIDKEYSPFWEIILTGIFRLNAHLTSDYDLIWLSTRKKNAHSFQAIGFEYLRDRTGNRLTLQYNKVRGICYPMIRSIDKIREQPENIEGFDERLHEQFSRKIEKSDIGEWIKFSEELHKKDPGYYEALFVAGDGGK